MEHILQYVAIFGGVVIFAIFIGWVKTKINFGEEGEETFKSILETIRFIVNEFNLDNNGETIKAIEACYEALEFINNLDDTENLHDKRDLIEKKALEICESNHIDLGDKLIVEVINRVTDYIIAQEFAKALGV